MSKFITIDPDHLHSIMYLLIRLTRRFSIAKLYAFTFHNVSINSEFSIPIAEIAIKFTFHNVSINSH